MNIFFYRWCKITAISDQSKSLNSALTAELSHAIHAYCCYHLQKNLMKLHSEDKIHKLFWQITKAQSKSQFEEHLETIQKLHTAAADYLQKIPSQYWSKHAIPGSQYGHHISNIAESLNFSWLNIQNLSILAVLQDIWNSMMKKFYIQANYSFKNAILTDYIYDYSKAQWKKSWHYHTIHSNKHTALIFMNSQSNSQSNSQQYTVNLITKSCSCMKFQNIHISCQHAIAAIAAICKLNMWSMILFMKSIL